MNKELIKSYILGSNYYKFSIENIYTLPKYIYTISSEKKLDLEYIRNERLGIGKGSSFERSFNYDLSVMIGKAIQRKPLYNYIREFPIIIENRDLWNELLDYYNVDKEDKIRDTNYFLLDFFFYNSDTIVEIDSDLHKGREIYDKARDRYIKSTLGIDTLRFYNYGEDLEKREEYKNSFRKKIKDSYNKRIKLGLISGPSRIDFSETLVNNYIKEHKQSLLFIDSIARFLGTRFKIEDEIEINWVDLHKIFPKIFKRGVIYKGIDPEMLIIEDSIGVMFEIYGKILRLRKPENLNNE